MDRPLRLALIGVVIVTMAACSSTATQSPTGIPAGGATATTAEQGTPTPAESPGALPSFVLPHNATELEALLPDKLGTETLSKTSSTGADFAQSGFADPDLVAWLQAQGRSLSDIAVATAFSPTFDNSIFAFRVNGVDHNILISEFQKAENSGLSTPIPWTPATVGGKSVLHATTDTAGEMIYLYGVADLFFEVTSSDPAIAAEALSKLP